MRSPFISLACAAGALVMVLACEARAAAAGPCCESFEESKAAAPDSGGADASGGAARAEAAAPPAPTPLDPSSERLADAASYADVFRILSRENSCSDFFGGPRLAPEVFNRLALQLRSRPLGAGAVSIRMTGGYVTYQDYATGSVYRLFHEAVINSNGPFPSRVVRSWTAGLQVGRFRAETRPAKALTLLHELGHLVGAPGGGWLLPNDGGDQRQSDLNTRTVESRCLKQLLALDK